MDKPEPDFTDYQAPYDVVLNGYNADGNLTPTYDPQTDNTSSTGQPKIAFSKNTVYFLFNSTQIQPQFIPIISRYSEQLRKNPKKIIILEGHADERGSREYNIALGEERAKAVAQIMYTQGVLEGQLEFVSYGEEKPASAAHNETAWHLNRRVNLIHQRN